MSENGRTTRVRRAKDEKSSAGLVLSRRVRQAPLRGAVPGFDGLAGRLTALDTFDCRTQIADRRGGREADASNQERGEGDAIR